MHFDMTKPCDDCPFRKEGGIKLARERIEEIAATMLSSQGATFSCHKTTHGEEGDGGEHQATGREHHCAGALIFAEKHETATQAMRMAERLGIYDHAKLAKPAFAEVWDGTAQWIRNGTFERKPKRVKSKSSR